MLAKLMAIAIAGGCGALCRYGLAGAVQRWSGSTAFPWGTFAVNLLGCLLFGLAWSVTETRLNLAPEMRLIALTGFMGAFTTFSTFGFETAELLRDGEWLLAGGNVVGQNLLGVALVIVGMRIGTWI